MVRRVDIEKYDISYIEGDKGSAFIAVVKTEDGDGSLVPVIAGDEVTAMMTSKKLSHKVLFVCRLSLLLEMLRDAINR